MIIETFPVTPFEQNCRLLLDPDSKDGVIVDPGGEVERVMEGIQRHDAKVFGIWLTHAHLDHCGGVSKILRLFEAEGLAAPKLYGHSFEREMRGMVKAQASLMGVDGDFENCPEPDVYLDEVKELFVGSIQFEVLFTPGHSPGHVVFFCRGLEDQAFEFQGNRYVGAEKTHAPILISGDTLFKGSIGRTDLPGGNHRQLINSIMDKIMTLPEDTVVLAGHGSNTTVRREKATNPFLVGA